MGPSLALWAIHLVLRLLEVADLCSITLSDPANRLRKLQKKKTSAVPLFRSGRRSPVCARLTNKRKLESQEDRNLGVYPLGHRLRVSTHRKHCLLYTSDAADEL